jgi:hypothetical protein
VEADRRRILEDIQATTGIELLNRAIKEALVESCLLEAASCAGLKVRDQGCGWFRAKRVVCRPQGGQASRGGYGRAVLL